MCVHVLDIDSIHTIRTIAFRTTKNHFLVHLSSPEFPPRPGRGLALLPLPPSRLLGSQPPPPPSLFEGFNLRSNLWPARREETKSFDASLKCMKLQKPPRLHSPFSFWRQQASRKSVTGESSAYSGRPTELSIYITYPSNFAHTCIPPFIATVDSSLCLGLPLVSCVYIPDQMIPNIIANLWVLNKL